MNKIRTILWRTQKTGGEIAKKSDQDIDIENDKGVDTLQATLQATPQATGQATVQAAGQATRQATVQAEL